MLRGLFVGFALLVAGTPAMAACDAMFFAPSHCSAGNGPERGGCRIDAHGSAYELTTSGNSFRIKKLCDQFPFNDRVCSCSDLGIW